MRSSRQSRLLPALAVFAAIAVFAPVAFSESSAVRQSEPNAPMPQETAAPVPAPPQQLVAPQQAPPTPEELGDSLMEHQRYQAAITAYMQAPRTAILWNKMGIAYQLMFNAEEAEHCYEASLRLDRKNARVMNNLGTIYDSEKEYSNAERMYRKAVKLDQHSAIIYKNLGTNLLVQRKYAKGKEAYQTAISIDPNIFKGNSGPRIQNPTTVGERGAINYFMAQGCVRAGMTDCAIDYLRLALNEGFTNPHKIEADTEFAGLHSLPAFQQLLAEQKQQ
jgi:tetratricopeptide (TPR) repeat protein